MADLSRVATIKVKIERAKEHVDNLKSEVDAFLKSNPYVVIPEDEQQTGDRVFRVRIEREIPRRWAAIAGDAIHNLRSAFDHLAWQLVEAHGEKAGRSTEFPISLSGIDKFESGLKGKVKGASDAAVCMIKSLEPYIGGDERFPALHFLDIADKHRLLITVGASRDSVAHGPEVLQSIEIGRGGPTGPVIPLLPQVFPLEDGREIYRIKARLRGQMDMDPYFHFEIEFGESGFFKGKELIESLLDLTNLTDSVINMFFDSLPELT